ncbi:noggin-2 [Hemitrygon akajei]|uniref:noggin-2 n=1 Tax=Hypanus sabinus TaxID=79690 RepID=UPI0028C3E96C|nr:noggin-2 [Hypanus sabinus]
MEPPQCFLSCLCVLLLQHGLCQPYLHLRPVPSDSLPVLDIIEQPDPDNDPKDSDLDERALRKRLGSHFDPSFMSITLPEVDASVSRESGHRFKPLGALPNDIKRLDLSETPYGRRMKLGKKARRRLQQWLWSYTYCPVMYTWKDLGGRFWPRFVKEGNCYNERSCSFPEGMLCKPVKSISKTFLRWYCQGWSKPRYCTWIPVQYPVISECKCAC